MTSNYHPWRVDLDHFQKHGTVRSLLDFAVLAPSSHNSQPWLFEVSDDRILVYANRQRQLVASDVNDRELYISLGCAITNIVIAAQALGLQATVAHTVDKQDLAATITFHAETSGNNSSPLLQAILTRTNNRNPYSSQHVPAHFFESVRSKLLASLRFDVVTNPEQKKLLAETVVQAGIEAMNSEAFRQELNQYVKSNFTRSSFGMPGFGMGIPAPISLLAPTMVKHLNMNRLTAKKDFKILTTHTPVFGIISSTEDNPDVWLKTGEFFETVALQAEASSIRVGVWAAPIEIGSYYQAVQKILGIQERPQMFFRMGYTNNVPKHSPRLQASATLKE